MPAPIDISALIPESLSGDAQVQRIAEVAAQVDLDPALPTLLREHLVTRDEPPAAILAAIANDLHVDDWDPSWTTQEAKLALREAVQWHRFKGTPESIRWTLIRAGVEHSRIFEPWIVRAWFLLATSYRFDDTALDTRSLDTLNGSLRRHQGLGPTARYRSPLKAFWPDESLERHQYWVALRPGWGPAAAAQDTVDSAERLSADRQALKVPATSLTTSGTSVTSDGKHGDALTVPDGADAEIDEGPNPGAWALSGWVYVDDSAMDPAAVLLSVAAGPDNRIAIERDHSNAFVLAATSGGTDLFTEGPFSLPDGWHYLTLKRDDNICAAVTAEGGSATTRANAGDPFRVGPDWRPQLLSAKGGGQNAGTRISDHMLWRATPTDKQLVDQAARQLSITADRSGVWPAFPRDLTSNL
jgi:phage tail P2-like protein